ncbi:ABC transporter substrate-binding protein [Flexilinea flocculi]|jgi:peptide/nickel transport system substrate-binding protein|uniref:ABC-type transport system, periplasmic component n=1 Tax=Flexilinea flocculi TaxID=1678840 RepID=A0A0S7BN04_9CHLR|nr:ABC transporter substrate-binding protein [Flexilinea flocculi]GAP41802.1 ABC-type transport system, periplasmic component [Flexilinea flocculi]
MKNRKCLVLILSLFAVLFGTVAVPAQSGTNALTIGISVEPISLDPAGGLYVPEQFLIQQIFDPLIAADPALNLHPALAKSWEVNEDGTEFTFHLREDVKFQDGTKFTGEAVKISFDRAAKGTTVAAAAPTIFYDYIETQVVDDTTVVVKFSSPHATFLQDLTRPWLMISSPAAIEKYGEDYGQHPVGTGPFILKEWATQDHITLTKNPDYNWAPEYMAHNGPALLDEITFRFLPEQATRIAAFQSGEASLVQDPSYLEASQMATDPNVQLFTFVNPGMTSHQMINVEKAPTDDINVRKALIYAVDQETISQIAFYGLQPAAHSVISPSTWGYNEEAAQLYSYDPEKAAALLEESGWIDSNGDGIREKDGVNLHIEYPALPTYEEAFMELLASYLQKAGFEVNITKLDDAGISEFGFASKHNILNMGWISRDPAVLSYVYDSENIEGGNQSSYTRFRNDRLDEILRTAPQTIDEEARKALYQEAQMIIMENAIALPIHCYGSVYLADSNIAGFRFDPEGFPYLYEISITAE